MDVESLAYLKVKRTTTSLQDIMFWFESHGRQMLYATLL